MPRPRSSLAIFLLCAVPVTGGPRHAQSAGKERERHARAAMLDVDAFRHYVEQFNADDVEGKAGYVDNRSAWEWLRGNVPFFECSDKSLEEMYYFRWWTYRKHIKQTPEGFVITEFLPEVPWAGRYNTISAAAAHHFYEGRWLRDRRYLGKRPPRSGRGSRPVSGTGPPASTRRVRAAKASRSWTSVSWSASCHGFSSCRIRGAKGPGSN